jgi:hypothetical protein
MKGKTILLLIYVAVLILSGLYADFKSPRANIPAVMFVACISCLFTTLLIKFVVSLSDKRNSDPFD